MRKIFEFIIIIALSVFIYSQHIIFELSNYVDNKLNEIEDDLFSYENFIKMKIDNNIYTRIKIGNPYQEIIAWLDTEEYSYYLYKDICKLDSYYDETKSKTFCPNNDEQFLFKGYGKTTIINESFTFGQKEIKKFPIIFMQNPKNDKEFNQRYSINDITGKSCVTIGLRFIKNYYETNAKNFISVLNELDIIDDSILFFEYDEKGNEQFLLIGEYPYNVFKDKYKYTEGSANIKIYNRFKAGWGLEFNKIYSGDIKLENNDASFRHNLGVIYAPSEYKDIVEIHFFNRYINSKVCTKINNGEYIFYYCDKIKLGNEAKNFPELTLIKNEFEEEFILTYKDLFFTKGNNSYFLIVFHHVHNRIWELGKPFLKKFLFAYNFDSKIIIHYNISNNTILKENELKETKTFFIYIIIASIFIGILCFVIGKRYYNKRKMRAKELENKVNDNNKENNFILIEK